MTDRELRMVTGKERGICMLRTMNEGPERQVSANFQGPVDEVRAQARVQM